LVAAIWTADRLRQHLPQAAQSDARELEGLLQRCVTDVRSLSYLLHPPLLDEEGLEAALRSRVESYRKCSGISVDLEFAGRLGRLPPQVELTIFRLVEEALSNVERHSGSATARILVERERNPTLSHINLTVEDHGKGMVATDKNYQIPGKPATFRFRVIIHNGDAKAADVAGKYKEFTAAKPTP
jgi:signal transduction histidine kinase